MTTKMMTEDDLQFLEHCNKMLREHLELVQLVTNESEGLFSIYLPILQKYVSGITELRKGIGQEVVHIVQSSRELKVVTSGSQEIHNFVAAVLKLKEALTPEMIENMRRLTNDKS